MKNISFQNLGLAQKLFEDHNTNLDKIATAFDISINSRGRGRL